MKKFVSWRRVSTKKQENSGLGLAAQSDIINYFVNAEQGELIADFAETYTGKDLAGCVELHNAIEFAKENDAILIIAKTDRFRSTIEALQIYDDMGEGKIYFCDLPHTDKFTLTLFFALAEREAKIVSIRTKAALAEKRKQGFKLGRASGCDCSAANEASAKARRGKALNNENNKIIWDNLKNCTTKQEFDIAVQWMNRCNIKTSTGLEFTRARAQSARSNLSRIFQ